MGQMKFNSNMQKRMRNNPKICFYYKIHNFYAIIAKIEQNELLIFSVFRNDSVQIVASLVKAYFWYSQHSPLRLEKQCNEIFIKKKFALKTILAQYPHFEMWIMEIFTSSGLACLRSLI